MMYMSQTVRGCGDNQGATAAPEEGDDRDLLLTQWSVAEDAADSVLLTVSELVTNAVEHARPPLNFGLSRDPDTQRVPRRMRRIRTGPAGRRVTNPRGRGIPGPIRFSR
jgi:hypothetical protein